ncbi:restriction endonuclease subunit S [Chryseobacterium flavum]|nr:restriction endonuclease subunit S [Chryseobacterium flavum]
MTKENKNVKNFPNSRNVPKLRFSEFSDEWENKKLGALMTFKVTNSYSRDNLNYESGTIKNIHYGDIHTKFRTLFDLENENVPYINEDISLSRISEDFYCQEGDVIFADASEDLNDVGKSIEITNLNGEKLLSGLHTLLARPQKKYFSKGFLGFLLKSDNVRNQIKREAQGSKVLSINVGRISNIHLSFPSFSEQHKISEFLSLLDERIQTQKKIIEKLESLINGWREKLFSKKSRFKDEKGNHFSDWKFSKLGEVLTIQGGFAFKSILFNKGTTKVLRIGDISRNINLEEFTGVFTLEIPDKKYMVNKGDFLMALSGATFGKVGKISCNGEAYINQRVATFRTNQCLEFFYQLVQTENFVSYINSIPTASAQPNISNNDIAKYESMIPCLEEQNKIANFLSSIQEKIDTEKQILEKLELQKKFLLANLFV